MSRCSHSRSSGTVIGRFVRQRMPVERRERRDQRRHVAAAVRQQIGDHVVAEPEAARRARSAASAAGLSASASGTIS